MITTGVVFRPQSPPQRLREVVEATEAAGVAELWLWEDLLMEGGLTAAAAALAWSERLRIGIGLLPVTLRNPALVAMEIATLAHLFPDRFVAGLGHGARSAAFADRYFVATATAGICVAGNGVARTRLRIPSIH
jgi:alkanesulfonate monooxygenase SsuD/methylene tetrahydromethanopterin reductase-like flavin-dependent oxidoreductase (luciferase family)